LVVFALLFLKNKKTAPIEAVLNCWFWLLFFQFNSFRCGIFKRQFKNVKSRVEIR
jgi:hypothetical protein